MLNKKASELMVKVENIKSIMLDDCFHDAIEALNQNKWGAVFVVNKQGELKGIITDGDARRIYAKNQEPLAQLNAEPAEKFMNPNFTKFSEDTNSMEILKAMNSKLFLTSPIIDKSNKLIGVVHLQHLVSEMLKGL